MKADGAAALLIRAQELRDAAGALKARRTIAADDRLTITSWLYRRAARLANEARVLLAANGKAPGDR